MVFENGVEKIIILIRENIYYTEETVWLSSLELQVLF
jgi:hypothetical protein